MSNSPLLPLSEPKPRSINLVPTGMKPIFAGVAAVVLVAAAAGVAVPLYRSHTGDAALSRSTGSGDLSPALYETAPTDMNANGNVPSMAEVSTEAEGGSGFRPGGGSSGAASSMQRVSLADPVVGIQDAMSLNIPIGWKFQGGIARNVPCSPGDAFPQMQIASPDGAYSLTVMTPFFTTSMPTSLDMRSCGAVAPLTSTANILAHYVVPALRQGAQTSAPEAMPNAEKFIQSVTHSSNGIMMSGDAARVHVSYTRNGQSVEEYIVGLTTTSRMQRIPGGTTATMVEIYKAPAGKLDAFFQQAAATMEATTNPQWAQRNAQLAQQAASHAEREGEWQRAAILQNGQDAGAAGRAMLSRTRDQIQATGQASMDAAARSEAARHTGAVGTADYVGKRPTSVYYFCNASGGRTTNNNPNSPGPGWYPCN
jgi:hypothetical protein